MGTISTAASKVAFSVKEGVTDFATSAKSLFESAVGSAKAVAGSILQGDVVGIDEKQVPQMQAAIKKYVKDLQDHLAQVKKDADTSSAFKGEYAAAVTEFVEAVCDSCYAITSQLLAFHDQLSSTGRIKSSSEEGILEKYKEKDKDISSSIKSQGTEVSSQFKAYGGDSK